MAWIPSPRDVLDYECSDCTYSRVTPTMVVSVNKYVLAADRLPNWDLVLTTQLDWLVTQNVVNLFEAGGITGCQFVHVATSEWNGL